MVHRSYYYGLNYKGTFTYLLNIVSIGTYIHLKVIFNIDGI